MLAARPFHLELAGTMLLAWPCCGIARVMENSEHCDLGGSDNIKNQVRKSRQHCASDVAISAMLTACCCTLSRSCALRAL